MRESKTRSQDRDRGHGRGRGLLYFNKAVLGLWLTNPNSNPNLKQVKPYRSGIRFFQWCLLAKSLRNQARSWRQAVCFNVGLTWTLNYYRFFVLQWRRVVERVADDINTHLPVWYMNTPNSILFLWAVRTKTEDIFIAWFLKKDLESSFCFVCRVFLSYYKNILHFV